jgi:hypothetical protein
MRRSTSAAACISLIALATPVAALAYVGPGLGMGAIAAFFGAVLAVLLAIVGVVWYPIKRLFGKRKSAEPLDHDRTGDGKP